MIFVKYDQSLATFVLFEAFKLFAWTNVSLLRSSTQAVIAVRVPIAFAKVGTKRDTLGGNLVVLIKDYHV